MTRSIYITSTEGDSGKSTVALGITAALARSVGRVGIFRPVARVADGSDYVVQLLLAHDGVDLSYEECVGVTYDDVHEDADAALATIVARYHDVARRCDAVVIVGTDYTDVSGAAEFEFNARIAANLAAPVALVVHGIDRTPAEIAQVAAQARADLELNHAHVAAIFANRCKTDELDAILAALPADVRMGALPEDPILVAPLVSELVAATGATFVSGDPELLSREARSILIGAMTTEHLLDRLEDGALVITAGDRDDTLLALLSAHSAGGFPALSGIILDGRIRAGAVGDAPGRGDAVAAARDAHPRRHLQDGDPCLQDPRPPQPRQPHQGGHRACHVRAATSTRPRCSRCSTSRARTWSPR